MAKPRYDPEFAEADKQIWLLIIVGLVVFACILNYTSAKDGDSKPRPTPSISHSAKHHTPTNR